MPLIQESGRSRGFAAELLNFGFVSSNSSAALKEYIETRSISTSKSRQALKSGYELFKDILSAQQKMFGDGASPPSTPSANALGTYSFALDVVVRCQDEFGVTETNEIVELFTQFHQTLAKLAQGEEDPVIEIEDVESVRKFFQLFSKMLVSETTSRKEEKDDLGKIL